MLPRPLPVRFMLAGVALVFASAAGATPPRSCPAAAAAVARSRYESLDVAGVIDTTSDLDACPDGTAAELAEALRWRAQALMTKGNMAAAEEAFARIETLVPGYVLDPALSPKLHELHRAGRARATSENRVFARLGISKLGAEGAVVTAEVYAATPGPLAVLFQFEDGAGAKSIPAQELAPGRYQANVPKGAAGAYRVLVRREGEPVFLSPFGRVPAKEAKVAIGEPLPPRGDQADGGVVAADLWAPEVRQGGGLRRGLLIAGGAAVGLAVVVAVAFALAPRAPDGSLGRIEIP